MVIVVLVPFLDTNELARLVMRESTISPVWTVSSP